MLSALQQKQHNFSLGAVGEQKATHYLLGLKYEIRATNVRLKNAEIDIIAFDRQAQELVFIEVKTRSTTAFGDPSTAVTRKKLRSLEKVARAYCKHHQVMFEYRFDTIAVLPDTIEHFKNITWAM